MYTVGCLFESGGYFWIESILLFFERKNESNHIILSNLRSF